MDPLSVLRTLIRHKWVALPVVLATLVAGVYVMFFAPRSYEAGMTYALITPKVPSTAELQTNPDLARINGDNPYLRSPDSTLLSQVLITKLGGQETADELKRRDLGTEYTVAQASNLGSGMLLQLSAAGTSPEQAVATVKELASVLTSTLYHLQKVNGADDAYLFSALPVDGPGEAKEIFSSRLRTLIIVLVGGAFLVFGAVSIARSLELTRERKAATEGSTRKARSTSRRRQSATRLSNPQAPPVSIPVVAEEPAPKIVPEPANRPPTSSLQPLS
jgi:hypothetical protein